MKRVKASKKGTDWTPEVEKTFLEALSRRGRLQDALDATGITRKAAEYRKGKDSKWAETCGYAIEEWKDRFIATLVDRATIGIKKTYIRGGQAIIEYQPDTPAAQLVMRECGMGQFSRLELTGKDGREIKIKVVE